MSEKLTYETKDVCPGSGGEGKYQSRDCRWCGRTFPKARPTEVTDKHVVIYYRMPRHYRPD